MKNASEFGLSAQRVGVVLLVFACCCIPTSLTQAATRRPANVPPTLELEILDPQADPEGNPTVELQRDAQGNLQVDIPRTIIVHKFYYNGDRSFQAQLLRGGPSIVVASHPKTGKRCYIDVQMFPGAPRVVYTSHAIEYDYGAHGVIICFVPKTKVVYRNGTKMTTHVANTSTFVGKAASAWIARTGLPEHATNAAMGMKGIAGSTAVGVKSISSIVLSPAKQLVMATPIGSIVCPPPEKLAQVKRESAIQCAKQHSRLDQADMPTVR